MAEASATAEGELARTPLAHLLVYALDWRLTGALFLAPPSGEPHAVRLVRGVPVKVRPGDGFSPLGEMLVEAGAIDQKTLEAALATKGLLGDVLLLAGRVERDVLEKVAEEQFKKRMVRLFALPAETTYRYHDAHEELAEYGGDPASIDPLALIWAGLRTHGEVSVMMDGTLARLGDTPLRFNPATTVARFALDAEEAKLCDELSATPLCLSELCAASFPGLARRFAYALAITRQLEMGTGLLPLGVEAPPSSSQRNVPPATAVARMALRSTVHRVGAAAPDAPGDGERVPVLSRRARSAGASPDEPSSSRTSGLPPISTVEPVSGPDSGVVEVAEANRSSVPEPAPVGESPKPPAQPVEPTTLRSSIPSIEMLRGSVPDLEGDADLDEVAAAFDAMIEAAEPTPVPTGETAEPPAPPVATKEAPEPEPLVATGETSEPLVAVEETTEPDSPVATEEITEPDSPAAMEETPEPPAEEEAPTVEAAADSEAFEGLSASEIFWLATECLAERDLAGAVDACEAGRREVPDDPDLTALAAWARAQLGGADIKALAIQLDEVLGAHEDHVEARYYRGMLRKRLGDEAGSLRDLQHVLELKPEHEGASLALAAAEQRQKKKERPSLFGKLFKR